MYKVIDFASFALKSYQLAINKYFVKIFIISISKYFIKMPSISIIIRYIISYNTNNLVEYSKLLSPLIN